MGKLGNISLKFMDIMIGVVLGLGFQWWPNLIEPWQYAAFIFVYLDLVDYWIHYSISPMKFLPRHELGILLDVAVIFMMFLYIYSTQLTILHFLAAYVSFKIVDVLGLWRTMREHNPQGRDRKFVTAWIMHNFIETTYTIALILIVSQYELSAPVALGTFVVLRLVTRIVMSFQYKHVYFT